MHTHHSNSVFRQHMYMLPENPHARATNTLTSQTSRTAGSFAPPLLVGTCRVVACSRCIPPLRACTPAAQPGEATTRQLFICRTKRAAGWEQHGWGPSLRTYHVLTLWVCYVVSLNMHMVMQQGQHLIHARLTANCVWAAGHHIQLQQHLHW